MPHQSFEFGPFRVDTDERVLLCNGQPLALPAKAFDTLVLLVHNPGRALEKEQMMRQLWPDVFVEEANLAQHISLLRKVLGETRGEPRYIETVPKRGYRFIGEVRVNGPVPKAAEAQIRRKTWLPDRRKPIVAAAALILALILIVVGIFFLLPVIPAPFQKFEVIKLAETDKATQAAISPDGKYVAYAVAEGGPESTRGWAESQDESLWLSHLATMSAIRICPTKPGNYSGLIFSRDGDFVYSILSNSDLGALYRTPLLGGSTRRVIPDVHCNAVAPSPDWKRLAFLRMSGRQGQAAVMVTSVDGKNPQQLAVLKTLRVVGGSGPSWSPDGRTVICSVVTLEGARLVAIPINGGPQRPLTSARWKWIESIAWLSDGSGLVVNGLGMEKADQHGQIWYIRSPSGETRRITNDLNDYEGVSLTSDSRALATVMHETLSDVWVTAYGKAEDQKQITSATNQAGLHGVGWTPDGRIVFSKESGPAATISIMQADGESARHLLEHDSYYFRVSPDGRHIVFSSFQGSEAGLGTLWAVDIDGGNLRKLTSDGGAMDFSPDGKSIVYASSRYDIVTLWKVAADGGKPVQLTDSWATFPSVSPDGKTIAYLTRDDTTAKPAIALMPFEGGRPRQVLNTRVAPGPLRWTPDGKALLYVLDQNSAWNIWRQSLSGGSAEQVTDFKSQRIFAFDLSRDGKQLALARGTINSQAVLLRDKR
jgi:Tol biopolymer transport system component/DNA-binding winged helix-turn-helix (wHTH) protein